MFQIKSVGVKLFDTRGRDQDSMWISGLYNVECGKQGLTEVLLPVSNADGEA